MAVKDKRNIDISNVMALKVIRHRGVK